jgi:hypothetical protein
MTVASVKHWQWLALGVVVGLMLWGARRWSNADPGRLGDAIYDPARFERALTTKIAGVPAFKRVSVYRTTLDDGAGTSRVVHVVSGKFCDGRIDPGDGRYHWRPAVFVAPVPYETSADVVGLATIEAVMRYRAVGDPTVLDFLRMLEESGLVEYRHAWWDTYPMPTWFGGSVLLIGVAWPLALNLVLYGWLLRPREPKGIDLSAVSSAAARTAAVRQDLTEEDLERLREMEAALAAGLASTQALGPVGADGAQQRPDRAAPLTPADEPAAGPAVAGEQLVFGAKADDYYPTARGESRGAETREKSC